MRAQSTILALAVYVASAGYADAQAIRCDVQEKYQCEPAFGCNAIPSNVWNIVDLETNTISRCDSFGCDDYQAAVTTSGRYIVIEVPGLGFIAKMTADGSMFSEVATIETTVVVSFGGCRAL